MRLLALNLALLCAACHTQAQPPAPQTRAALNLTGTWKWKQGQETLELTLKQEGSTITGTHSAIGQRGAKVDEVAPDAAEPSLKGELKANVATVEFHSGYPDATGHGTATLSFRNGQLLWQIVKSEGEHYLPKTARLSRAK